MISTFELVRDCAERGEVRVSYHGAAELKADGIQLEAVLASAARATLVEEYPSAYKGPSILVLHRLGDGSPVHVVWGFAKGTVTPVVLVTAYRPDPRRWSVDLTVRRAP